MEISFSLLNQDSPLSSPQKTRKPSSFMLKLETTLENKPFSKTKAGEPLLFKPSPMSSFFHCKNMIFGVCLAMGSVAKARSFKN